MTNQSEPTGLNVDEIKFTKMITVLNGRKCSHVRPANTESDLVTVTNSTVDSGLLEKTHTRLELGQTRLAVSKKYNLRTQTLKTRA